jgi:hypothetical protein
VHVTPGATAQPDARQPALRSRPEAGLVVEVGDLRPTLLRAGRLLVETGVVPMVLFLALIHTVGLLVALAATLGWLYLALAARFVSRRRMPGTLCVCVGLMSGRALAALATSSAFIYMIQPVVGSVCMAVLFVGSALTGRPITVRLARDFVAIPAHILNRRGVRRMFTQIALIWGISRLLDAAMNVGLLRLGLDFGLLSRGVLSPALGLLTVGLSVMWGRRALHRDGVNLRFGAATG